MKKLLMLLSFMSVVILTSCNQMNSTQSEQTTTNQNEGIEVLMRLNSIHIRDSFIFVDRENNTYYLTGTAENKESSNNLGFVLYKSDDLTYWTGPISIIEGDSLGYEPQDFWAPEIHYYNDKYYLFGTFGPKGEYRRTQIWSAPHIEGPYQYEGLATPENMGSLDATLYEEDGKLWSIYCYEWLEPKNNWDGQIRAVELKSDLSGIKPETDHLLFKGSDSPHKIDNPGPGLGYITDGTYMFRNRYDELFMLWSTFTTVRGQNRYILTYAKSDNGKLDGNWIQAETPLYDVNGGHGIIFEALDGTLKVSFHAPNTSPYEKTIIYNLDDSTRGILKLK